MEYRLFSRKWLAGFFDGEGSIGLKYNNHYRKDGTRILYLYASITQNNKKLLLALKRRFNGAVSKHSGSKCFAWQVSCNQADKFLRYIYPYLKLKKKVADLAFKHRALLRWQGRRKTGKGRQILKSSSQKHERIRNRIMWLNQQD